MSMKKKGIYIDDIKTIENISGPASMYLLTTTNPKLPTILLFGDYHESYQNMCDKKNPNTYVIYDQKFIDLFDFKGVHYFLEDAYHNIPSTNFKTLKYLMNQENSDYFLNERSADSEGGPLDDMRDYATPCYSNSSDCKSKHIKWHYVDIRMIDDTISDPFFKIIDVLEKKILSPLSLSSTFREENPSSPPLFDFHKFLYVSELTAEFENLKWLIKYMARHKSFTECIINSSLIQKQQLKCPIKLLDRLQTYYKKLELKKYKESLYFKSYSHLLIYMTKFVNDYALFMHEPTYNKNNLSNFYKLWKPPYGFESKYHDHDTLKTMIFELRTFSVDIYAIQRSFKYKYDSKLNIFYLGHEHIQNILHFLVNETRLYSIKYKNDPTHYILKYKLLDWIPEDKLDLKQLNRNPNAIDFLKEHPAKIDWNILNENPNAPIEFLLKNRKLKVSTICQIHSEAAMLILSSDPSKINWSILSANPVAIELLEQNKKEIDWKQLSANPNAIHLLKKNPDKIDWQILSSNPNAIELLTANPDKIDWHILSANPYAIHLLKENPEQINWKMLSSNPEAIALLLTEQKYIDFKMLSSNPNAIDFLKEHTIKIKWAELSSNPNAIQLLKNNQEKIDWEQLSKNPSIFEQYKHETANYEDDDVQETNRCLHINKYIPIYNKKKFD